MPRHSPLSHGCGRSTDLDARSFGTHRRGSRPESLSRAGVLQGPGILKSLLFLDNFGPGPKVPFFWSPVVFGAIRFPMAVV
jgi:hypothetical protein